MKRAMAIVVATGWLALVAANAQESFKNRWFPNDDPIPTGVAPLQSTTTTTVTTPEKTITTTTSTPWGVAPMPPIQLSPPVPAPQAPIPPPVPIPKAAPQLRPQPPVPQQQKASSDTTSIYAIAICIYYVDPRRAVYDGCRFPENGMALFRSQDECRQSADMANRGSPFHQGDTSKRVEKCFKRTVNSWTNTGE